MSGTYRPDIDGLRAIAIIPVVLFHARVSGFNGGFVGVDVFFVISGFLITGLIKEEIDAGTFSYVSFWERRARRLLPPLFLVVAATCITAYQFLFPEELKKLGQSVVAISVFASNIYFWLKSGYFETPAETVPLLHTWTLAVEEQFYLLFPAILVGLSAWGKRVPAIAAIGIVSFALSVWWVQVNPDSAYYLLPSRAWELMLGATLALSTKRPTLPRIAVDALLLLGLTMITLAVSLYKETTPFPGVAALLPCGGTALIIWLGEHPTSLVRRTLDNSPMVFVGKLSYSMYLWHWPLLVLLGAWLHISLKALTAEEVVLILGTTIVLSWLSLTFIENPIRRRKVLRTRRAMFLTTGSTMAALATFGLCVHIFHGYESRIPVAVLQIADGANDDAHEWATCGDKTLEDVRADRLCRLGSEIGEPKFLLWGDSHAQSLLPVVDHVAKTYGVRGVHVSHPSCPPMPDVDVDMSQWAAGCRDFNDGVFERISQMHLDAVFLAAIWSAYADEGKMHNGTLGIGDSRELFAQQLRKTIDRLTGRGITVFIVEAVPYPPDYLPARFAFAVWKGAQPNSVGISVADYRERNAFVLDFLDSVTDPHLVRISPLADLCRDSFCPAVIDGRSVYRDEHHLSTFGADRLTPGFREAFGRVSWK